MKKFRKPRCPYCGDRLNYAKSWVLKHRGDYICPKCGGISNIVLSSRIYGFGFLTVAIASVFFVIGLIFSSQLAIITLPGIFLAFLIFFLTSPLLVRLQKPALRRPRPSDSASRSAPRSYPPVR